jgi:uncharacterized protein
MNLMEKNSFISEENILLKTETFHIGATMTFPTRTGRFPGVVLAGGSLSDLRDGEILDAKYDGPPRKAMQLLAYKLAESGYASLRWDKVGTGQSLFLELHPPHIDNHVKALEAVFNFFRMHPFIDPDRVVVAGESAGAYYTCLMAKKGTEPFAYALLGALGSTFEEMMSYNYDRAVGYADTSDVNLGWVERVAVRALATGHHFRDMFAHALDGKTNYLMTYKTHSWEVYLPPIREELAAQPLPLFDYLRKPVLIIQGDKDMNVPPGDAFLIENRLRESGNHDVTREIIPNADHNFQISPADPEERIRERISLRCLSNPYSDIFYKKLVAWLNNITPYKGDMI